MISTKTFHDNHFDSIQALRGITAIFIILEHVQFLNCGAFGVDIFFCISGFMIMFSTHKNTKHFLGKRFLRILPLYEIMTILTFIGLLMVPNLFQQSTANLTHLLKSMFFIPFDIGGGLLQPLVRIGWTVNCEIFFYIIFFLSFKLSHKFRGLICGTLLCMIVFGSYIVSTVFSYNLPHFFQFYGQPVMLEFIFGIISYYLAWLIYNANQKNPFSKWIAFIALFAILTIFFLLIITKPTINTLLFRRILVWGIPSMFLVLFSFTAGLTFTAPKFLVFLGNISFSLYLVHYYPITFLDRVVFDFGTYSQIALVGVLLGTLICITLAYLSWLIIEKFLTKHLLKLFRMTS